MPLSPSEPSPLSPSSSYGSWTGLFTGVSPTTSVSPLVSATDLGPKHQCQQELIGGKNPLFCPTVFSNGATSGPNRLFCQRHRTCFGMLKSGQRCPAARAQKSPGNYHRFCEYH